MSKTNIMSMIKNTILATALITILSSCGGNSNPKSLPPVSSNSSEAQPATNINSVDGLVLSNVKLAIPAGWTQEKPSSQMRVAQLVLKNDPKVKMAIFYFGEQDMIQENIDRWRGQFVKEDSFKDLEVNSGSCRVVKILGIYKLKPFPMAQEFKETPNYGVLAAIVNTNKGPYYLKIEAPKSIIEQEEKSFLAMLDGQSYIDMH